MLWSEVIDLIRVLIFGVAHVCNGSVGVAVILVSLVVRLALLPLTLRLARRAAAHRQRLQDLKPELERLQRRYADDPSALWRETAAFYRNRGVKQVDMAGMLGGLAQAPVFIALYSALRRGLGPGIRFLWIADSAVPNAVLTIIVAGLATASIAAGPATGGRTTQVIFLGLMGAMTLWFLSSTSALFALSTGAGSAVGALQGFLLRRESRSVRKHGKT
jgi:YidC/Oxa1 family membrane protein insertase